MAQQIADLLQWHIGMQQADRTGESESMCSVAPLHLDAGLLEPSLNDGMQRAAPGKRAMWRPHAQEHFTDFRLRPAATEIL